MMRFPQGPSETMRRRGLRRLGWDHFGSQAPPAHVWRSRCANDNEPLRRSRLPARFRHAGLSWLVAGVAVAASAGFWLYERWISSIL